MQPPVEIMDRSEYKRRMNELLILDKRRTVIVTVDMQNDYLDMQLATAPVAPLEAERVISNSKRLLDFARAEGIPVIHVYVKRRPVEVERGFESHPLVSLSQRARVSQNAQTEARRGPDRIEGMPQAELPAQLVRAGRRACHCQAGDGFISRNRPGYPARQGLQGRDGRPDWH